MMMEPELFRPSSQFGVDDNTKSDDTSGTSLSMSSRSGGSSSSDSTPCNSLPEESTYNHGNSSNNSNDAENSEVDLDNYVSNAAVIKDDGNSTEQHNKAPTSITVEEKAGDEVQLASLEDDDDDPIKIIAVDVDVSTKRQEEKVMRCYDSNFESDDEFDEDDDEDEALRSFQTSLRSLSIRTKLEWQTTSLLYPELSMWMGEKKKLEKEIENKNKNHPLLGLPSDILEDVLSYLDHTSFRMVQQVNREMHDLMTKVSNLNKKLWIQACCSRWPWLASVTKTGPLNEQEPKINLVDALHLPTPLEFVSVDGSIINYGLLLALSVSCKLQSNQSTNSEIEAANNLLLLKCSSGNMAMYIDERKFLFTATRNGPSPRFRFIKNNNPEEFSERYAATHNNNDISQYCTTVQYIGNVGVGYRSIRTKQPFYCPELITKVPISLTVIQEKTKLGFLKRLKSSIKRYLGRKYTEVKHSASVMNPLHHEDDTNKLSYFWKPYVIPFVSSYDETTKKREIQLMPRLVSYFEMTILSPESATITRHLSERPQESVREVTESVAIGIADCSYPLSGGLPGWDMQSYGYHGDNGHVYHGSGGRRRRRRQLDGEDHAYGPRYGVNDTVGCGIDYHKRSIFFTFNGTFLGYAFQDLPVHILASTMFYPVVGIDSNCPIYCNFGYRDPFAFDLTSYILLHQKDVLLQTLVVSTKNEKKRKSRKPRRKKRTTSFVNLNI